MAPPRMSKQSEAKILHGVERMIDLVEEGLDPNAALTKVAVDGNYPPGHLRLMAQAYNTGRTNFQRKAASDPLSKTASFPLADAVAVLEELYPSQVKSAAARWQEQVVSEEYACSPGWLHRQQGLEKAAYALPGLPGPRREPYPRDPARLVKKAFDLLGDLERDSQERRRHVAAARDKAAASLERLDGWFRQVGRDVLFPAVYQKAGLLWGTPAVRLLDKTAAANSRLRLNKSAGWDGPVDLHQEPWRAIEGCLQAARDCEEKEADYQAFRKEAEAAAVALTAQLLPPLPKVEKITGSILSYDRQLPQAFYKELDWQKQAFEKRALLDVLTRTVPGVAATDTIRGILDEVRPPSKDKLKSEAYMELTDPDHEAQLRKIRTRSILHDLLANDDYLSGEKPQQVTDLYNKISHLSPRAAEQPILMQALLRRYLAQGQVDPHDLDQLVGIEHRLKAIDEPSREVNLPRLPGSNLVSDGKPPRRED